MQISRRRVENCPTVTLRRATNHKYVLLFKEQVISISFITYFYMKCVFLCFSLIKFANFHPYVFIKSLHFVQRLMMLSNYV